MAIEVVLFDLGGVVLRYQPERRLGVLSRLYDLPTDVIDARVWRTDLSARFDEGRITTDEWYEECSTRLGRRLDRDTFDDAILSAFSIDHEVLALVQSIRGARVAALTNNSSQFAAALPRVLPEVANTFVPLLCSYEFKARKPDPAAFRGALQRLHVTPERVLFFDDQESNVLSARAVGLDAERFTGAAALQAALDQRALRTRSS